MNNKIRALNGMYIKLTDYKSSSDLLEQKERATKVFFEGQKNSEKKPNFEDVLSVDQKPQNLREKK